MQTRHVLCILSSAQVFAIAIFIGNVSRAIAKETPAATGPGVVAEKPAGGHFVEVDGGYMVPYTESLPGTDITFEMMPVPGGEFLMGSQDSERDRAADEGPQVRIKVEPFWIAKCEVNWAEYQSFMSLYDAFKKLQLLATNPDQQDGDASQAEEKLKLVKDHAWNGSVEEEWGVDAVTTATPLYDSSFTYEAGDAPDQPAVTMTQFAAKQYTKWLSGILGRDYRLPSEAEWEYAARAGTTTAYSFGDDAAQLGDYAWFDENADFQTHPVGSKKPNAWGIHDMHGNVAEWTLDEYREETYAGLGKGPVDAAIAVCWPTKVYPRVIRGGSWLDSAPPSAAPLAISPKKTNGSSKIRTYPKALGGSPKSQPRASACGLYARSSRCWPRKGSESGRPTSRTCAKTWKTDYARVVPRWAWRTKRSLRRSKRPNLLMVILDARAGGGSLTVPRKLFLVNQSLAVRGKTNRVGLRDNYFQSVDMGDHVPILREFDVPSVSVILTTNA